MSTSSPVHHCAVFFKLFWGGSLFYCRNFSNFESSLLLQFFKCYETKLLHVWSVPPHKTALLSKNFILPCIPIPRSSHRRCSVRKDVVKHLGNVTQKHLCLSFFLIKLQTWRPVTLFRKTPTQVLSCEIFKNFWNTYLEEHLRTTAPERLKKISPLLVLGNRC